MTLTEIRAQTVKFYRTGIITEDPGFPVLSYSRRKNPVRVSMGFLIQALHFGPMQLTDYAIMHITGRDKRNVEAAFRGGYGRVTPWGQRSIGEKYIAMEYCNAFLVGQYIRKEGIFKDDIQ